MKTQLKSQLNKKLVTPSRPVILNLNKTSDQNKLEKLFAERKITAISDDYHEQLKELFAVQNPSLVYTPGFGEHLKAYVKKLEAKATLTAHGRWVYFPWNANLVHILEDKDFQTVRTARNRYLINEQEQAKFYNSTVGIGGLSVGNSVILAIVLQGGAKHIKLADFDQLALSNLNRIRGGITSLGLNKTEVTARQIYELNPYATVELFPEGLTEKNLNKFFSSPKLDIIIDELDNIAIKHLVRQYAKKYKIPLVMGADNGDNAVVDIERYDQNPKTKFFHGRIGNITYNELKNLDKFGIGKTITSHIGPENIGKRMQDSLLSMGKTIVSWPQLGGAALLNGSAVAYCVRKILNGQPLENNRAIVSLDELFIPNYNSPANKKQRQKIADSFKKLFGLK
jgi:predicted ThiF/HesA family dinucleotide-utilizing enzyme